MGRIKFFFCFLLVLISSDLISQDNKVAVEPSETWMNNQHQPEKLMDAIGLKEGMTIADIGAGRGRMTVFFSLRVGNTGKVYANDIDKDALEYLENRCRNNNMTNVTDFSGNSGKSDAACRRSRYCIYDQ